MSAGPGDSSQWESWVTSGFPGCVTVWGCWEVQVRGEVGEASVARPRGGGSGWLARRGWGAVWGSPSAHVLRLVAFHSTAEAWAPGDQELWDRAGCLLPR